MYALALLLTLSAAAAPAQESAPVLLSRQAADDVELSADPDSAFWKGSKGVLIEKTILGEPATNLHAEVRSRWTREHLYFLVIARYDALNLRTNADTSAETYRLWLHDCFEVYLGADSAQPHRYRELQMSPQGEFLDLDIDSTKPRPGYNGEQAWNSGMKVKARIDEARKVWCGEMRVPFSAIDARTPRPGNELRVNFCRQDGARRRRTFMAWQPTGAWTPHRPEKFGALRLVEEGGR